MAQGGGPFEQNQLKFNLGVPLLATNMAARFHKPQPVIIERAGPMVEHSSALPPSVTKTMVENGPNGYQFTSLSEDKMALAVKLAQRDLKRQKEGLNLNLKSKPSKERSPSPKGSKTKVIRSKECRDRMKKHEVKGRVPLKVREHGQNREPRDARMQTPPKGSSISCLPVTTNSPPTRDTDAYPRQTAPHFDNPGAEIERLQKEMEEYLQQIQVIEQRAMKEQDTSFLHPVKSRRKEGYLPEEEDPVRMAIRAEEQATRVARQLYFLRQQVRTLQTEVTRIGPDKMKHTKKSQAMTRLAAAHRGAVRAIQFLVTQQLPQQDLKKGLPASYHELSLLIRQLTMLSTQISKDSMGTVHQDLIRMLDRVEELNKAWCAEVQDSAAADSRLGHDRRRKSPVGRLEEQGSHLQQGRQLFPAQKKGKENKPKGLLKKQVYKGVKNRPAPEKPVKVTPERRAILRAGIQSLLQDEGASFTKSERTGMAWDIPVREEETTQNRSLILPQQLQSRREKAQKSVVLDVPPSHFADPTLASSLKSVSPTKVQDTSFSAPTSPRGRSPWRPGGKSAKSPAGQRRARSQSPASRQFMIQDMDRDFVQELFPEEEERRFQQRFSQSTPSRSPRRSRSPGWGRESSLDRDYRIRQQLGPVSHRAKDLSMAQDRKRELSEINLRQQMAERAFGKDEVSGSVLADLIFQDILRDTAEEMGYLEEGENHRREAVTMRDHPTLENIYQRLELMEIEQNDIRRRWGTLEFGEQETRTIRDKVSSHRGEPSAPSAVEITKYGSSQSRSQNMAFLKDEDEPIIFTKVQSGPKLQVKRTPVILEGEERETVYSNFSSYPRELPRTKLTIPERVVREIRANLEKYESHLKRSAHQSHGRFDPWQLVEEISDHLLEDCLAEIDKELEDVGDAIVHQVCKTEFALPERTASPPTPPSPPAQGVMEFEDEPEEISPIDSEEDLETPTMPTESFEER